MNAEAQRIALASWMGWVEASPERLSAIELLAYGNQWFRNPVEKTLACLDHLPNYPASLDACAEVEAKLTDKEHEEFQRLLWASCRKDHAYKYSYAVGEIPERRSFVSATAAQRCEALCRALDLWEGGEG